MGMTLPARLQLQFGEESFSRHCRHTSRFAEPACIRTGGLEFDLDTAADWHWFAQHRTDTMSTLFSSSRGPADDDECAVEEFVQEHGMPAALRGALEHLAADRFVFSIVKI